MNLADLWTRIVPAAHWLLTWTLSGYLAWYCLMAIGSRIGAYRAQRKAEQAAWLRLRQEEAEAERIWRNIAHALGVKPSPIAIHFTALNDECAALRLIDRINAKEGTT